MIRVMIRWLGRLLFLYSVFFFVLSSNRVLAATLSNRADILTRLKASENSSHLVTFTLDPGNTFAVGETITIDFDEDGGEWVVDGASLAVADLDLNDGTERVIVGVDGDCSGHVGVNDVVVGVNDTTGLLTMTACSNFTASSAGATVAIEIGTAAGGTDRIANPASTGVYLLSVGGTFGDSGDIAVEIVTEDQVVITGTVEDSISFSVNDTSIGFGLLTELNARYATGDLSGSDTEVEAHNMVVGTNATNGYSITVNGSTLSSGSDTIMAIGGVNTASSPGSEQYGIRITASGGSGVVSSPYDGSGFALDTSNFPDEVASVSGPSSDTTYSVRYLANIASGTAAGIYSSVLIFIGTGNF